MRLLEGITKYLAAGQVPERKQLSLGNVEYPSVEAQAGRLWSRGGWSDYRIPSIDEALGVPAIQRAVRLISNTTGSLAIQAYREGGEMDGRDGRPDPPRVVVRPDPWRTPHEFYRDTAWNQATRGEFVWWIASRDGDGRADALVNVPLHELTVDENPNNRLLPEYTWGQPNGRVKRGTRFSGANPTGSFVHGTLMKEPGALRGYGPLQLCGAAISVTVEAQEWAARFYGKGGYPSINLHNEDELEDVEAEQARNQWMSTPQNMPQVTSGTWSVREIGVNPQGAQMLDARQHQNGEAARMYGIPGTLLEFNSPGSSLTYQNITEIFTLYVKACLGPDYLVPIEEAMSDLLTRSTAARFNVKGFERADIKTRFEVYEKAVAVFGPEEAGQWAREQEGLAPGDVEYRPVPFAAPGSVPVVLSSEVRCDGMRMRNGRLETCGQLLAEHGPYFGQCRRCKKVYAAA